MRAAFLLLAWLWLSLLAAHAGADERQLSGGDREAIQTVVAQQLEAFQRDDGVEAFSYASPSIQAQFKTPGEFMRMVREAYEPVYRPRFTYFLEALVVNGQVIQPVQVVGPDDGLLVAWYVMERQPDGTWRISGCVLNRPHGQSA